MFYVCISVINIKDLSIPNDISYYISVRSGISAEVPRKIIESLTTLSPLRAVINVKDLSNLSNEYILYISTINIKDLSNP